MMVWARTLISDPARFEAFRFIRWKPFRSVRTTVICRAMRYRIRGVTVILGRSRKPRPRETPGRSRKTRPRETRPSSRRRPPTVRRETRGRRCPGGRRPPGPEYVGHLGMEDDVWRGQTDGSVSWIFVCFVLFEFRVLSVRLDHCRTGRGN